MPDGAERRKRTSCWGGNREESQSSGRHDVIAPSIERPAGLNLIAVLEPEFINIFAALNRGDHLVSDLVWAKICGQRHL